MLAAIILLMFVAADAFGPIAFLQGAWTGEGAGGTGWFTFAPELGGKVVVRRNHAEYPATPDRPASTHDDLMYIYREPGAPGLRAIYFDVEGHVIHYTVEPSVDGVRFVSDVAPAQPAYRLTYARSGADTVRIRFEIAPPGRPEAFKTYIDAAARRKR